MFDDIWTCYSCGSVCVASLSPDFCPVCGHCRDDSCGDQYRAGPVPPAAHSASTPVAPSPNEDESHTGIGSAQAKADPLHQKKDASAVSSSTTTPGLVKYMWVCCHCGNGPFVTSNHPQCVTCCHIRCRSCEQHPTSVSAVSGPPSTHLASTLVVSLPNEDKSHARIGSAQIKGDTLRQWKDPSTSSSRGTNPGIVEDRLSAENLVNAKNGIHRFPLRYEHILPLKTRQPQLQPAKSVLIREAGHKSWPEVPSEYTSAIRPNEASTESEPAPKPLFDMPKTRPSQIELAKQVLRGEAAHESWSEIVLGHTSPTQLPDTVTEDQPAHKRLCEVVRRIDPASIQVNFENSNSILDAFKNQVESSTRQTWDWWPLKPAQCCLRTDKARISWDCLCGERRSAVVPITGVRRFRETLLQSVTVTCGTEGTSSQGQLELTEAATKITRPAANSGTERSSRLKATPEETTPLRPSAPFGQQRRQTSYSLYLLFVVKIGSKCTLSQILMDGITTRRFFRRLRIDYLGLRGFLRSLFSVWVYSHCDFYKFVKFDADAISPQTAHSFPDSHEEGNYEFHPKPMQEIPPIPADEFKRRFYACYHDMSCIHCLHQCYSINSYCNKVLAFLPKCKSKLDLDSTERTYFWGLYAREAPAAIRVLVYSILCLAPMMVFFFMWLFSWKHAADLQNASVPLFATLAFLSIFWGILLSGLRNTERLADVD